MRIEDVAVATVTWARDQAERSLIQTAVTSLSRFGMPVAFADGGSEASLVEALEALPRVARAHPQTRGLVPQVQASAALALSWGTRYILYCESDKGTFFEERLASFIERAPGDAHTGIVLASRSADSFATFPPLQRLTETTLNQLCESTIGERADYSYGPFLMHRALAEEIAQIPAALGWGWRPCVFGLAARHGLAVHHVADDHPCPPDQRQEDDGERLHRMRQLAQNVEGLILSQTMELR